MRSAKTLLFADLQVAETESWSGGDSLALQESIREGAGLSADSKQKGAASPAWEDDKFLTPVLENDPLLYSFDDEGEDDDVGEMNAMDRTTALRELLDGNSTSTSTGLQVLAEPGSKNDLADLAKVFLSLDDQTREELASPVDVAPRASDVPAQPSLQDDGAPDLIAVDCDEEASVKSSNGTEPRPSKKKDKKDLKVTFAEVAKREARNVNKDYFGSYSAFGIHREMLSDKVLQTPDFGLNFRTHESGLVDSVYIH
jgi:protein arginine N-methyltransferase 3